MKHEKYEKVYLTFETDSQTAYILKDLAHRSGKTQPELINEICKDFIKTVINMMKEEVESHEGNRK